MDDNSINKQNINYKKYEVKLRTQYPHAYKLFLEFEFEDGDYLHRYIQFFSKFDIELNVHLTETINPNYKGTFVAKIKIKNENICNKLQIECNGFDYYGHSNYENAMLKGLIKSFNIIECLETGKTITKKRRSTNK